MKPSVPAIETSYARRRFRSRCEARWAVMLDACGLAWDYEPEGYALPGVGPYLPDFWIPAWSLFLEIKGAEPTEDELAKCQVLAQITEFPVLIAAGAPDERFQITRFDHGGETDGLLWVIAKDRNPAAGFWLVPDDGSEGVWLGPGSVSAGRRLGPVLSGAVEQAYAAALSHRFERTEGRRRQQPIEDLAPPPEATERAA